MAKSFKLANMLLNTVNEKINFSSQLHFIKENARESFLLPVLQPEVLLFKKEDLGPVKKIHL